MEHLYETERLILKIVDESQAEKILDYYLRNKDFLDGWEPKKKDEYYTIDNHRKLINLDLKSIEEGKLFRVWIFKKNADKIIGTIAFNNIVRGAFLSCHLGYKLDVDELNQGYITEALQRAIHIAFEDFGLHRIEANIMPRNTRSLRVVEKLGFYNEGLAYKYLKINGKWEDHIHMVLLNDNI